MFAERFIFNRRPYSDDGENVPDAEWSVFIHQFSSFALASYTGQTAYASLIRNVASGKMNLAQVKVPDANHRSTFLTAVAGQFAWFNSKRSV